MYYTMELEIFTRRKDFANFVTRLPTSCTGEILLSFELFFDGYAEKMVTFPIMHNYWQKFLYTSKYMCITVTQV